MSASGSASSPDRYRLRLLLSELRREAELHGPKDVLPELDELVRRLEAEEVDHGDIEPRVRRLAARFGRALEPSGTPVRWLSFLRWTGPGMLLLVVLAVLVERRRRRQREVSDALMSRLEAGSDSDSPES